MRKLLVIDDSETNTMLIKSLFEYDEGIEIIIENDSLSAIETVKATMPSLILLDLMMPGIDGEQILRELKQIESTKDIPIVVISAKQEQEDIDTVMELGALEYIKKPIGISNLYDKVRELLFK